MIGFSILRLTCCFAFPKYRLVGLSVSKKSGLKTVEVGAERFAGLFHQRLTARAFARTPNAHLSRYNQRRDVRGRNVLSHLAGPDALGNGLGITLSPRGVQLVNALAEPFVQRRHLLRQVVQRTALHEVAARNVLLHEPPEGAFYVGDRVG